MIVGFKHKGLKLFYERGDGSRLPAQQLSKIRLILTRLDAASAPEQMNVPGYRFHALTGNMKGLYSVKVTGNYRITFGFDGNDATDVDYIDYH